MDPAGSPDISASPSNAAAAVPPESNAASSSSPAAALVAAEAEQAPPPPNPAPGIVIQEPVLAGTHDHEASTSGGGGDDQCASPWLASPASTSALQSPPHSPVERALNELAFSRFRNNMRVEARRSSARRSLLGRLGALPGDETTFSQPKDQHPWQLQNPIPPFPGWDGLSTVICGFLRVRTVEKYKEVCHGLLITIEFFIVEGQLARGRLSSHHLEGNRFLPTNVSLGLSLLSTSMELDVWFGKEFPLTSLFGTQG
ncbi:uncharacterized protein LOC112348111 [Selaginella moellendorffii]|uniref:uncharacterized protein LOC112348111 n=1 Tax=Selaginella moellendorffii TaxID=88036 RepID=UPI000D1CDE61|nr:uncharacterized protein LOC112348111 [Selaginella moellendorffii]|eukprot:XP_024535944.1 uncharacterized protein LOC112348111 [Selaginella moellendorffii]